jgi:hypothetical protein
VSADVWAMRERERRHGRRLKPTLRHVAAASDLFTGAFGLAATLDRVFTGQATSPLLTVLQEAEFAATRASATPTDLAVSHQHTDRHDEDDEAKNSQADGE